MALTDLRLATLAFARRWDGAALDGTLLLLPSGDPTAPWFPSGAQPFAGTELALQVVAVGGSDAIARTNLPGGGTILPADLSNALPLFQRIAARFNPQDTSGGAGGPPTRARIVKALPDSYVARLPPGAGRAASAATPDQFACAMRDRQPPFPPEPPPARAVAWGEVLSYALRNPSLARALGLVRDFRIDITAADFSASGGWLYVTPSGADDGTGLQAAWALTPDAVKCYAALIPPLDAPRELFSALLFPVSNPDQPVTPDREQLDRAFEEALAYSQGFARLVHVHQPDSVDGATGANTSATAPGNDSGIQIGWDDEQVSEWHNRQLGLLLGPAPGGTAPLEAPIGALGYRIDVRIPRPGEPANDNAGWTSLMTASGGVPAAFAGLLPPFEGELVIEPAPTARFGAEEFWLPLYFAQWQGTRLGLRDDTARLLAGGIAAGVTPASPPSSFAATGAPPRLVYGRDYQFRVRLTDLTMQGPGPEAFPQPESPAQRASLTFARHVPPKSLGLQTTPAPPRPDQAPPIGPIDSVSLTRPRVAWPEALFTPRYGATDDLAAAARNALLAQLGLDPSGAPSPVPPASNSQLRTGLPDPDVVEIAIRVEARVLAHDTADDANADGSFVTLYQTRRPVPPLTPLPLTSPGVLLAPSQIAADEPLPPIAFAFADVPEIDDPAWKSGAGAGALPLPRARDLRLSFTPIADGPPGYFGSFADRARTPPQVGLASRLMTRAPATAEANLFAPPADGAPPLQAFAFRAVADGDVTAGVMQRLAPRLALLSDGLTLHARPGERVVFGCSGAVKHQVSPDGARITFASTAELLAKWVLVYQVVIERDWTWDGIAGRTLTAHSQDPLGGTVDIGTVTVPRVIGADALAGTPDRGRTRIVFVHAIDPTVPNAWDGLSPRPPIWLGATVEGAGGRFEVESPHEAIRLPVVVPPAEMPDIVSAGYALAPFAEGEAYRSTAPRSRRLWLEFTSPPPPGLAIVARVLAYAPDPLLYHDDRLMAAPPPSDPALPLDPEYARVLVPGQLPDEDGAEAMVPLVPAQDSPTRFLLPLPVIDPAAPELFGLWTYEFRFARITKDMLALGYAGPVLWSTAHGRYGRPLRLAGVQHPAPTMPVSASWVQRPVLTAPAQLVLVGPYATPVRDGQIVGDGGPRTTIVFALYAQVPQADGSAHRNILLTHVVATHEAASPSGRSGMGAIADWQVTNALDALALPRDAGLSVVAVEFLPAGGAAEPEPGQVDHRTDPLGIDYFGRRRILRTSPLTPVSAVCGILEPAGTPGH